MTRPAPTLLALALLAGPAAPAAAQAVSALKGHDSHAPVDVSADRIEVQDRSDRAIFSGNVRIVQNEMTLTAQRVNIAYTSPPKTAGASSGGGPQVQRMDASGTVVVTSPTETARGDFGVYDTQRRLITMLGNVVLTRGDNVVRGGRLVTDLDSGRSTLDGHGFGGGGAGTATSGGRVTGRFTVPQRTTPAPTPAGQKPVP